MNAPGGASLGGRAGGGTAAASGASSATGLIQVETVPSTPSCGIGCRLALARPVEHDAAHGHGFSLEGVVDTNPQELFFAKLGSDQTRVLKGAQAMAFMEGTRISFLSVPNYPQTDVMVLDTGTGVLAPYTHFDADVSGAPVGTMLSDRYLFWMTNRGTGRADLKTGAVVDRFTGPLLCDGGCVVGDKLFCLNNDRIQIIDVESGASTALDDGGALQLNATCAPDRSRLAWVDFRDPPGKDSGFFANRVGGEIYSYDTRAKTTVRLTHDSPDAPITKVYATAGTDLVVWSEPCAACEKNPYEVSTLLDSQLDLVRLDLDSRRKCRLVGRRITGYGSLHGHHLYAYWNDGGVNMYVVDLDLDHPDLPWVCE